MLIPKLLIYKICSTTVEALENTRRWLQVPPGLTDMTMYCRKAKLKPPLKSVVEQYKCGKARLFFMSEDSEETAVKTIQLTTKMGRAWKVLEAIHKAKECLRIKEVVVQTQTDRKAMVSSVTKRWSKAEGIDKRDMVINQIRLNECCRRFQKAAQQSQQGQWTNWDNTLQKSLTWNDI